MAKKSSLCDLNYFILLVFQYDPRFGDAFWNSTKHSMMIYAFNVLTSWAIVCNVWYLPPMVKEVLNLFCVLKVLVKCCLEAGLLYYIRSSESLLIT